MTNIQSEPMGENNDLDFTQLDTVHEGGVDVNHIEDTLIANKMIALMDKSIEIDAKIAESRYTLNENPIGGNNSLAQLEARRDQISTEIDALHKQAEEAKKVKDMNNDLDMTDLNFTSGGPNTTVH